MWTALDYLLRPCLHITSEWSCSHSLTLCQWWRCLWRHEWVWNHSDTITIDTMLNLWRQRLGDVTCKRTLTTTTQLSIVISLFHQWDTYSCVCRAIVQVTYFRMVGSGRSSYGVLGGGGPWSTGVRLDWGNSSRRVGVGCCRVGSTSTALGYRDWKHEQTTNYKLLLNIIIWISFLTNSVTTSNQFKRTDSLHQNGKSWPTMSNRLHWTIPFQGSHFIYPIKFPGFSLTFPWFPKIFPWLFFFTFYQDILVKKEHIYSF